MATALSVESSLFGKRLREVRQRAGIAQDRLGVLIGLDEGSSSARMSRYESGVHEPPFQIVTKLAEVLNVPTAYFYCNDDKLAELMRIYHSLTEDKRGVLFQSALALIDKK